MTACMVHLDHLEVLVYIIYIIMAIITSSLVKNIEKTFELVY